MKLLFYLIAFITAWVGLVLMFKGFVVPGAIALGFGFVVFNVVYSTKESKVC